MAVKAAGTITLAELVSIAEVCRYYLVQSSTLAAPSKPTAYPPSGWGETEPTYTSGSTESLYTVECTVFTDNTFSYSDVSLSSSYEAAKDAFNEATNAKKTATNFIEYNSTNGLQVGNKTSGTWVGFRTQITASAFNILNAAGEMLASYGSKLIELGKNASDAVISFCAGKAQMGVKSDIEYGEIFGFESNLPMELTSHSDVSGIASLSSFCYDHSEEIEEGTPGSSMARSYSVEAKCNTHTNYYEGTGQASSGMRASFSTHNNEIYKSAVISAIANESESYVNIEAEKVLVNTVDVGELNTRVGSKSLMPFPNSSVAYNIRQIDNELTNSFGNKIINANNPVSVPSGTGVVLSEFTLADYEDGLYSVTGYVQIPNASSVSNSIRKVDVKTNNIERYSMSVLIPNASETKTITTIPISGVFRISKNLPFTVTVTHTAGRTLIVNAARIYISRIKLWNE